MAIFPTGNLAQTTNTLTNMDSIESDHIEIQRKQKQCIDIEEARGEGPKRRRIDEHRQNLVHYGLDLNASNARNDDNECFVSDSNIHIGCSGFSYKWWHDPGSFYPAGISARKELDYYSKFYDTVELNVTYHRIPKEDVFIAWRNTAPRPSFQYTVKANKFFTHTKRLIVDDKFRELWGVFWSRCQLLKPHLGVILFQFPSSFKRTSVTFPRLRDLSNLLCEAVEGRFVFEFRDSSWYCNDVYNLFSECNWCFCIIDIHEGEDKGWTGNLPDGVSPSNLDSIATSKWGVYLRFHGSKGQYFGSYEKDQMKNWSKVIRKWSDSGLEVYVYFNNTDGGTALDRIPSAILDSRQLSNSLWRESPFFD